MSTIDDYCVEVAKMKKITKKLEEADIQNATFEFIISSLFPDAWDRIKELLLKERIAGYNDALEELAGSVKKDNVN